MSEVVFDEMQRGRLAPDEARAILITVARRHAAMLELVATVDRTLKTPEPMSGEHVDRISGAVYRLLAERGRVAAGPLDPDWLRSCGLDPSEAGEVQTILDSIAERASSPKAGAGSRRAGRRR